jgi:hypothetical protein
MDTLWPWLAVAGVGALHGLNPLGGWLWAAAHGWRSGERRHALRAMWPMAVGHIASVVLVALAVPLALSFDLPPQRWPLLMAAAALWLLVVSRSLRRRGSSCASAGHGGMALFSFIVSTAHGTGLMLVPALLPLCIGDGPARPIMASGSVPLVLAAVAVHGAAMLGVASLLAVGAAAAFGGRLQRF